MCVCVCVRERERERERGRENEVMFADLGGGIRLVDRQSEPDGTLVPCQC